MSIGTLNPVQKLRNHVGKEVGISPLVLSGVEHTDNTPTLLSDVRKVNLFVSPRNFLSSLTVDIVIVSFPIPVLDVTGLQEYYKQKL